MGYKEKTGMEVRGMHEKEVEIEVIVAITSSRRIRGRWSKRIGAESKRLLEQSSWVADAACACPCVFSHHKGCVRLVQSTSPSNSKCKTKIDT